MTDKLSPEQVTQYRAIFNAFDRDGDETIDVQELGAAFSKMGRDVSPSEVASMIATVDQDGSGSIGFEEFVQLFLNSAAEAAAQQQQQQQADLSSEADEFTGAESTTMASTKTGSRVEGALLGSGPRKRTNAELEEVITACSESRDMIIPLLDTPPEREAQFDEIARPVIDAVMCLLLQKEVFDELSAYHSPLDPDPPKPTATDENADDSISERRRPPSPLTPEARRNRVALFLKRLEERMLECNELMQPPEIEYVEVYEPGDLEAIIAAANAEDMAMKNMTTSGSFENLTSEQVTTKLSDLEAFEFEKQADASELVGAECFRAKVKEFPAYMFPIETVCKLLDELDVLQKAHLDNKATTDTLPACPKGAECPDIGQSAHRIKFMHPCFSDEVPCPHMGRKLHAMCFSHTHTMEAARRSSKTPVRRISLAATTGDSPVKNNDSNDNNMSPKSSTVGARTAAGGGLAATVSAAPSLTATTSSRAFSSSPRGEGEEEKQLGVVRLNAFDVGDYGAIGLAEVLLRDSERRDGSMYNELYIQRNQIGPAGGIMLIENAMNLTVLDLSHNHLGYKGAQLRGSGVGPALRRLLQRSSSLLALILSHNRLSDYDAKFIADGLMSNTTLKKLDLRNNEMGPISGVRLAQALSDNRNLKELFVGWNLLEGTGTRALLQELKQNNTLEIVDLSWTGIRDENGGEDLGEFIVGSAMLRWLNVSHNDLGSLSGQQIARGIELNRTLTYLNISYNPLGDRAVFEIAKHLRENNTLEVVDMRSTGGSEDAAREMDVCRKQREAKVGHRGDEIFFSTSMIPASEQLGTDKWS